jgi:hypothetical protein
MLRTWRLSFLSWRIRKLADLPITASYRTDRVYATGQSDVQEDVPIPADCQER